MSKNPPSGSVTPSADVLAAAEAEAKRLADEAAAKADAEAKIEADRKAADEKEAEAKRLAHLADEEAARLAATPKTVRMTRDEPTFPKGPTTADVALDEVENWQSGGWVLAK